MVIWIESGISFLNSNSGQQCGNSYEFYMGFPNFTLLTRLLKLKNVIKNYNYRICPKFTKQIFWTNIENNVIVMIKCYKDSI